MIRSIAPCAFARMTSGGVSSVSPRLERGQRRAPRGSAQPGERHHRHALDVQRRQHARHVRGQRALVDDHQHLLRAEAARIGERQVGDAVQADGGLAAARRSLDRDQARRRLRDQLELARIDQRRDGGQVAIGPPRRRCRRSPSLPRAAGGSGGGGSAGARASPRGDDHDGAAVARDLQARLPRRHLAPLRPCAGRARTSPAARRPGAGRRRRSRRCGARGSRPRPACRPGAPRRRRPLRSGRTGATRARCASRRSARRCPVPRSCARRSARRGACRSLPGAGGRSRATCDRRAACRPCRAASTAPRSGASAPGSIPGPRAWPRRARRAARSARWRRRPGCAPCAASRRRACATRRPGAAAPRGRSGGGRVARLVGRYPDGVTGGGIGGRVLHKTGQHSGAGRRCHPPRAVSGDRHVYVRARCQGGGPG